MVAVYVIEGELKLIGVAENRKKALYAIYKEVCPPAGNRGGGAREYMYNIANWYKGFKEDNYPWVIEEVKVL